MTQTSGIKTFHLDVPYELIETGNDTSSKPLLVYFHGFKDNIHRFKKRCSLLLETVEAHHLFLQGPYPVYERSQKRKVNDWGAAWYLYDGDQDQFLKSMEKTASFVDDVLIDVQGSENISRISLLGYSMGGYLAGYYALTRSKQINDLIVAGSRIKTEIINKNWSSITHLRVLAVHGERDKLVDYKPQRDEIYKMKKNGIQADFKLINEKHIFNERYVRIVCQWLYDIEYIP